MIEPTTQGEAKYAGTPIVMVRTMLCNLTCVGYETVVLTKDMQYLLVGAILPGERILYWDGKDLKESVVLDVISKEVTEAYEYYTDVKGLTIKRAVRAGTRARVFCASMANVFDGDAPEGARERLWALIEATPALEWLLLTKRIGNAARMLPAAWLEQPRPNVWLGATFCNQAEIDRDFAKLIAVPAVIHFASFEPLLGPIDLGGAERARWLDWAIVGGESGRQARPMNPAWARTLRDQCVAARVAFFMKQMGGRVDKRGELGAFPEEFRIRETPRAA